MPVVFIVILAGAAAALPGLAQTRRPATRKPTASKKVPALSAAAFEDIRLRAAAAREANQLAEAINLYWQAVGLRPSWEEGWWYLATMLYELDRYAEARDAFRSFVAIQPKGGAGWALMGLCEFRLREYEAALTHIQRGRLLGLGDSEQLIFVTRYHAALLLTRFAQFEGALEILNYLARTLPNENPSVVEAVGLGALRIPLLPAEIPADQRELVIKAGRASYLQFARRLPDAEKEFAELVARYPDVPNVNYAHGVFLLDVKPEAAPDAFLREIKISPSHVAARVQLAFLYINHGEHANGLPFAEQAVELAPGLFAARNALGRILIEIGDVARAIKELEAGVRQAPDSPEMHFALARAYTRAGRAQDARQARANFLRLDKIRRIGRDGAQSVGGAADDKP